MIREVESGNNGSQVARRKKHSTLTSGVYHPTPEAVSASYFGVFVDGVPYLLFVCREDSAAEVKARRVAASDNFKTLLEATSETCGRLEAKPVSGEDIDWTAKHTLISASRSGDVETGVNEIGEIRAILMAGSHRAVADTLCIDGALASLIDADFPRITNFSELPELSERDVRVSLGNLAARKYPGGGH